jgi:hypothetical protein
VNTPEFGILFQSGVTTLNRSNERESVKRRQLGVSKGGEETTDHLVTANGQVRHGRGNVGHGAGQQTGGGVGQSRFEKFIVTKKVVEDRGGNLPVPGTIHTSRTECMERGTENTDTMAVDNNLIVKIETVIVLGERGKTAQEIGVEFLGLLKTLAKRKLTVEVSREGEELPGKFNRKAKNQRAVAVTFPGIEEVDGATGKSMIGNIPKVAGLGNIDGIEGLFGIEKLTRA